MPYGYLLLAAVLSAAWFTVPGLRPLLNPDEGRYAEIPREMLASGEWITPHLNGLPYLEKPPLQYWVTASAYRLFGESEWSARLWPALTAYAALLAVFLLGRRLRDTATGLLAAAVMGSGALFTVMGQTLTLDMSFSALLTGMLASFCMAQLARPLDRGVPSAVSGKARPSAWMLTSWMFLALAVLTKGIAALAIAGGVLTLYMLLQRDWPLLRSLQLVPGLAVFAVIVLPWFVWVSRENPDFLQFFFVHEHFQRFLTLSADRYQPAWYFLAVLALAVLPWGWQAAVALARGWRPTRSSGQFDASRLLWVWTVFTLGFFSLSDSKLPPYILPLMPSLALLVALDRAAWGRRGVAGSVGLAAVACAGVFAVSFGAERWLDPAQLAAIPCWRTYLWTAAAMLLLGAGLGAVWLRDPQPARSAVAVSSGWMLALLALLAGWGSSDVLRTGKSLAKTLPAELVRQGPVYSVETYDQTLPFYIKHTLTLVNFRNELDYGLRHFPDRGLENTASFADHWRLLDAGTAVMPVETYERLKGQGLPMRLLGSDLRRVAVSRR